MAAIYSNGGNRWNILGFNFTKRDALSSVYKIPMHGRDILISVQYLFLYQAWISTAHVLLMLNSDDSMHLYRRLFCQKLNYFITTHLFVKYFNS